MIKVFTGSFTQQEPIPEEGMAAALDVMRHGRLHRYNVAPGEESETALLEREFAEYIGAKYTLAVASGGYAMATALRAVGVKHGDAVLTNAFSLAPVPGAIASVGAIPIFVGVEENLAIDLEDLASKTSDAKYLMLSHMRGHQVDMNRLMEICNDAGIVVIEDCAHTMGASWNGRFSGRFGLVGCYSTQTYKHMNSGEGGFIVTDCEDVMAHAVMLSGSYMLYERHGTVPSGKAFDKVMYTTPNISGRMDNLRAAILRPQLKILDRQCDSWNDRYRSIENGLRNTPGLTVVERPPKERYVGSSIQFLLLDWPDNAILKVVERCIKRGVELKWFGNAKPVGFTSRYDDWCYVRSPKMPKTDRVLKAILDMRLPLTFSIEDCELIASIIRSEVGAVYQAYVHKTFLLQTGS